MPGARKSAYEGDRHNQNASSQRKPDNDEHVTARSRLVVRFDAAGQLAGEPPGLAFCGENHFCADSPSNIGSPELAGTRPLLVNGAATTFADAGGGPLSLSATRCMFGFGGGVSAQFCLGSAPAEAQEVPAPGAVGLRVAGLAVAPSFGGVAHRSDRNAARVCSGQARAEIATIGYGS